jgi:hypothetical protein
MARHTGVNTVCWSHGGAYCATRRILFARSLVVLSPHTTSFVRIWDRLNARRAVKDPP